MERDETHIEQHGDGDVNVVSEPEESGAPEAPEAPAEAPAEESEAA
jgi:hypothetical protein